MVPPRLAPSLDDDDELLRRLQAGDEQALDALIARYHVRLHSFVRRYLDSADAADDALQELFVRLWQHRRTLTRTLRGSVRGYLYAAARNAAFDALRHDTRRRRREHEAIACPDRQAIIPPHDAAIAGQEFEAAVWRAVDELPPRCREIFILSERHGLSYPEIATALGVTVGTVKTQISRASARLASRLAPFLALVLTARS